MDLIDQIKTLVAPWVSSDEESEALAVAIQQIVMPSITSTGVKDGNHALLVGRIMGMLVKGDEAPGSFHALRPEPVMVGDDYSNKILVTQPSGKYLITVEPLT